MHKVLAPNSAVIRLHSWLRPSVGVKRAALTIGAALVLAAPFALANNKPAPPSKTLTEIEVRATPIAAFDKENPAATRFGKLTWRGGLVLSSATPSFGGWSGLVLGANGKQLVAVSDAGTWMTAHIVYEGGKPYGTQIRTDRSSEIPFWSAAQPFARPRCRSVDPRKGHPLPRDGS